MTMSSQNDHDVAVVFVAGVASVADSGSGSGSEASDSCCHFMLH